MYMWRDIYPDLNGGNTFELTLPEGAEHVAYHSDVAGAGAPAPAGGSSAVWIGLAALVGLAFVFSLL